MGQSETEDVVINDRYALRGLIASGAMAEVFLAQDVRLGREVAVKVFRPDRANDPKAIERFRREARAAAGLSHPNLVTVYDWGVDQGQAFLVTQYVAGSDLRRVIRQRGVLPEREALHLAADIAAGLDVAHRHGIVHRDVKPRNVLVDENGNALLADFGIAAPSEDIAGEDAVYGTALYVSPEQAQGLAVDGRADLYSLGALLYELLTGSPPFAGETTAEVAAQHINATVVAPRQIRPGLSDAAERAVLRALEKDPARRFRDAAEMRQALLAAAAPGDSTVRDRVDQTRRMPVIGVRRSFAVPHVSRRLAVSAAAALVLAMIALPLLAGAHQASVPDMAGQSVADAQAAVAAAGLTLAVDEQATEDTPAGVVVSQDPAAGSHVGSGATIHALVSSGPTVPDLGGRQCAEARAELEQAGWSVKPVRWRVANVADFGKVVGQDPPAGAAVPRKGEISVQVAGPVRPC